MTAEFNIPIYREDEMTRGFLFHVCDEWTEKVSGDQPDYQSSSVVNLPPSKFSFIQIKKRFSEKLRILFVRCTVPCSPDFEPNKTVQAFLSHSGKSFIRIIQ